MRELKANLELVAYCGLYCGACRSYLSEKCPGCHENTKATWCSIRTCCLEKKISTCAECKDFSDPNDCKKFNNIFSKIFGFIFRSDRKVCIEQVKKQGLAEHAKIMTETKRHSIKKK